MSSQGSALICNNLLGQSITAQNNITIDSSGPKTVSLFSTDDKVTFQVASGSGKTTAFRVVNLPQTPTAVPADEVYVQKVTAPTDLVGKKILCIV